MRVKRSKWAVYLDVSEEHTGTTFNLAGIYADEISLAMNPTTNDYQDVTQDVAESVVESYKPSFPVSTKVNPEDDVFTYLYGLKRNLATYDDAKTKVLLVDLWDSNKAELYDGIITINTYGGEAGGALSFEYTVSLNGSPTLGTATISTADKTATFTADI